MAGNKDSGRIKRMTSLIQEAAERKLYRVNNPRAQIRIVDGISYPITGAPASFGGQGGSGTPGPGGGGGNSTDPVAVHSPWYKTETAIANSGSNTVDYGPVASIVAATALVYLGRNGTRSGAGLLEIYIDGSGVAQIVPTIGGDDCGLTFTVDASSGNLILTITADGSGGSSTVRQTYLLEGVTARSAWGIYEMTRGTLVERGRFGVVQNGLDARANRRGRGDDCSVDFSAAISGGQLVFTVADRDLGGSTYLDGNATNILLDYCIAGVAGLKEWKQSGLSVPATSSANLTITSVNPGAVDWSSSQLIVPADSSAAPVTFAFPMSDGCQHIRYTALRGNLIQQGALTLWNGIGSGGLLLPEDWDMTEPVGITFEGSYTDGQLILTAYCDNSDALDTIVDMDYIGELQI